MHLDYEKIIADYLLDNIIFGTDPPLSPKQRLIDTGLIDSVSIVKVLIFLENEFRISFGEDDIAPENIETVEAMARMVVRKRGEVIG